jgi:hypothetical protein
MGQAKQRKAEIAELKQQILDTTAVNLYDTAELRQSYDFGGHSIVYPELNKRDDVAICNILVYPAGSNTPILRKMTNAGAVYMSWLATDKDRENEYLVEITRQGEDNGILVQSAVVSKKPMNAHQRNSITLKIMNSLPADIRQQFKGQIRSWIQDIKDVEMPGGAGTKVGWV